MPLGPGILGILETIQPGEIVTIGAGAVRPWRKTDATAIDNYLGEGSCTVLRPDPRLQVSEIVYYYPDAMGTCDDWW